MIELFYKCEGVNFKTLLVQLKKVAEIAKNVNGTLLACILNSRETVLKKRREDVGGTKPEVKLP